MIILTREKINFFLNKITFYFFLYLLIVLDRSDQNNYYILLIFIFFIYLQDIFLDNYYLNYIFLQKIKFLNNSDEFINKLLSFILLPSLLLLIINYTLYLFYQINIWVGLISLIFTNTILIKVSFNKNLINTNYIFNSIFALLYILDDKLFYNYLIEILLLALLFQFIIFFCYLKPKISLLVYLSYFNDRRFLYFLKKLYLNIQIIDFFKFNFLITLGLVYFSNSEKYFNFVMLMFLTLEIVDIFYFFIKESFNSLIFNEKYNRHKVIDIFKKIIKYFITLTFLLIIVTSVISIFQIGNFEKIYDINWIVFFFNLVVYFFMKTQGYFILVREDLINYKKDLVISCFFFILIFISNYLIIYKEVLYNHIFMIQIILFLSFMSFKHIK